MEANLKPETLAEIEALIPQYPQKRSAALPLLHLIQEDRGYICKSAIEWIAKKLDLEPVSIFELVTFYPMLRQAPVGKKHIKICRTLSCALAGSYTLAENLKKALHCPMGGTSPDGEYTLEFVECLASCGTAPVVMVDETLHERVKPNDVQDWLKDTFPNRKDKGELSDTASH